MFLKQWKRAVALMLALVMTLSVNGISAQAATSSEGIRITDEKITTETTSIHVNLDRVPSLGILKVIQMDAEQEYDASKLNTAEYQMLNFSLVANLQEGDNVLTLTTAPSEGMKVLAVLRDASDDNTDYVSNALVVEKAGSGSEQPTTPEGDISKNCSVKLLRTEAFTEADTSVDVEVNLDPSLTDGCYMTIFGYSSNMSFDPDMVYNLRLWSGKVTSGTYTCTFNQKLQKYHNVIACLNVPVGEDNYRSVVSQAIEVVDDSGSGFQDYTYPDVKIDEDTLVEGATTLHITLTGDERLFAAAQAGQTSITCAVGQYPADETFDFEGEHQISLASNISGAEPFSGKEITLSEPLKAGYRVRAVVYWSQNKDIFLAKGNDYEESFHRPDDSVLVSAAPSTDDPEVTVGTITEGKDFEVTLKGDAPGGSMLIIKSYPADTEAFAMNQGTLVAAVQNAEAGTITVSPKAGSASAGQKVVVFWHHAGDIIASSEPVTVQEPVPFEVTTDGMLLAGATSVTFHVKALVAVDDNNINVTRLCRIASDGKPDTANPLAVRYRQNPGDITFDGLDAFQAGERLCLSFTYMKDNQVKDFISDAFPVVAEDSILVQQTSFTTDGKSADIVVKGCEAFQGGYLFVSAGATGEDKDSRTRLASVKFTGEGTYTVTFSGNVQLKAGQTILAYLYKYDADADRIYTKEAAEIPVTGDLPTVEPKVGIVTSQVRADRKDVWVQTEFSEQLTAKLALYCHEGATYTEADRIYYNAISNSSSSQKVTFGEGKLTAGKYLTAELEVSDGTKAVSQSVLIEAVPEKQKPTAYILTKPEKLTAGITGITASMTIDTSTNDASYKLYQYTTDTFDAAAAETLCSGVLYSSTTNQKLYVGVGNLKAGAKLLLIVTADGVEGRSQEMTVLPSPDWGTPYAAFDVSAVAADSTEIPLTVQYSDEYLSLGDEFYCDVSVYQFSAAYTDDEFEKNELWENFDKAKVVAKANSTQGDVTNGSLKIPVRSTAQLNPGDRLIIKLRLPHTEWEGEEVDYIFTSIPVLPAGEEAPAYKVVLYNLGDDSSRGDRVRKILDKIGVPTETMEYAHLNETVGYLAGLDGYEAAKSEWTGATFDTEFMLLCNLPESLLDRFLDEMQANGLRIDHKAIVTEYNREYEFHELIEDIKEEHNTFQVLIALNSLVKDAEKLDEKVYGISKDWQALQQAIADANAVIGSYEPSEEELTTAYHTLKELYLSVTEKKEIQGTAIITVEKNDNGTYRLTASVKDGVERAAYEYRWRTGETGPVLDQVSAEALIGSTVEVSREDLYGTLKAQLQVPEAPVATIIAGTDYMKVTWNAPAQADNQPLPESYVVSVYKDGVFVKEITCAGDATEALVDGLEVQTGYTVKVAAVSPVGRSDRAVLTAQTQEKPSVNPGDNDNKGDNGNQNGGNGNNGNDNDGNDNNGGQNGGNSNNGNNANNGNNSNANNGSNGSNGNNSNGSGNGSSGSNGGSGSGSSNTDNGGSSSGAVKTGDNTPWELYLAGLLASAAIASAVSRKRRAK